MPPVRKSTGRKTSSKGTRPKKKKWAAIYQSPQGYLQIVEYVDRSSLNVAVRAAQNAATGLTVYVVPVDELEEFRVYEKRKFVGEKQDLILTYAPDEDYEDDA